ncbi:hypothetical protein BH11BAC5_BH11BAC5_23940 [soil metagenome]
MIRLFKKRKDKPSLMYPVFQRLGAFMDKRQRQCARYLEKKSERLNRKQQFYWLVFFCIGFGGGSLYLLLCSVESRTDHVFMDRMAFQQNVVKSKVDTAKNAKAVLTQSLFWKINRFKKYLDSLQKTETGKARYDSIVKTSSGLLDSMHLLEQFYQQQLKSNR